MWFNFQFFNKTFLILFAAFSIAFSAQAQLSFDLSWRQGTVILTSGDTLTGAVTLRNPEGILMVQQADGSVSTLTAVNVQSFEVRGERDTGLFRRKASALDFSRRYQTYLWNQDKDYSNFKMPAFFIVLKPGNHTLLMREIKVRQYSNSGYGYYQGPRMMNERIEEKYYLAMPNQEIRPLRNPKKDIPAIFPKQAKQIAAYAKENKLSYNDPTGLARIVDYANSL